MPIQNIGPNAVRAAYFTVKFKDIFHLKEFYRAMHEWLLEYDWNGADAGGGVEATDHYETLYLEKQGLEGDKEMWWWWRLQKYPVKEAPNSYYKFHLDIDYHILYMLQTEVMSLPSLVSSEVLKA